jgi:AcrR family transcriptional regulator
MSDRIFSDREKAMEADYFRKEEARLLEMLRKNASLDEIAEALRDKLQVDNPDLLVAVRDLGITPETVAAFFLAPLVQVAWAEGKVRKDEQEAVLKLARDRGIEENSPAEQQLRDWLATRPSDALFDASIEALKASFSVLPVRERNERVERVIDACRIVAEASGTEIAHQLGLGTGVSKSEASLLDSIGNRLRSRD